MVSTCWRVLDASADYPRLIAFLKAMEFSSLLRWVVEFSGVDANEIEADDRLYPRRGHQPRSYRVHIGIDDRPRRVRGAI